MKRVYNLYKINRCQEPEYVGTYDDPNALLLALLALLTESKAVLVERGGAPVSGEHEISTDKEEYVRVRRADWEECKVKGAVGYTEYYLRGIWRLQFALRSCFEKLPPGEREHYLGLLEMMLTAYRNPERARYPLYDWMTYLHYYSILIEKALEVTKAEKGEKGAGTEQG